MLQLAFVNFKKGTYLVVEEKESSDIFYIIQNGRVMCQKQDVVPGTDPDYLGPGDFVGVVPCMAGRSQIETVVAVTDVTAISVRRDQYPELIKNNTPVALKIIRTFAKRMRLQNENLTKLTLKNVIAESPEQLFHVAQYYEKVGKPDIAVYGYYQYLKACPHGSNFEKAKSHFIMLKPDTHAVYFEPTKDLVREYPQNSMIFAECQTGSDMFIIQSGSVKISKVVDDSEVTLAVLKKGDMFGEMALLENKPRSASAIAHENCSLMVINGQNFNMMVQTQAQLVARLTTTLAERLWSMSRQIVNTQIQNPVHKLVDMLALQIEKQRICNVPKKEISYQTGLTIPDIEDMCGIPQYKQAEYYYQFAHEANISLIRSKIYIRDCNELIRQAAFYRKKKA